MYIYLYVSRYLDLSIEEDYIISTKKHFKSSFLRGEEISNSLQ